MRKPIIVMVAGGAALTVGLIGCGVKESEASLTPTDADIPTVSNPPVPEPMPTANPPAPDFDPSNHPPPPEEKPAWDDVKSGHPEGATNPPIPVLVVTPAGDCFKGWRSPMVPPSADNQDRVQECPDGHECGVAVECPPKAAELLATWNAGEKPGPK